jgi:cytochrome P450
MHHILYNTDTYHKPSGVQRGLAQVLGSGVIVAEGERHRLQRKALNPAFGPGQLRDLTGIFLDKANEVRHVPHLFISLPMLSIISA